MKEAEIWVSLVASILNLLTAITNAIKEMFKVKREQKQKNPTNMPSSHREKH